VTFRGLPTARNYGWQLARHDLIVYVDDDIRCGRELAGGYSAALEGDRADICGGGIDGHSESDRDCPGSYKRWIAVPETGFASTATRPVDHARGCNFSATREVLRQVGGFDERFNIGAALHEETDLMLRAGKAGYAIMFDGGLRLMHLAARAGGTRQRDVRFYVYAFAHNRSIMVRRHSRWYQWPVGLAWSGKLIAAYTWSERNPMVVAAGVRGVIRGWIQGGKPPRCTRFEPETDR
jgi:GT2 family glycosyltransferase